LAVKDWQDYAARDLPTFDGYTVRLGDLSAFAERTAEVSRKFNELVEGMSPRLMDERFKSLPQETQKAMDTPLDKRTERQKLLAQRGEGALLIGREDLVRGLPAEKQLFGMQLLQELADIEAKTNKINGYRTQTNFDYWYMRSVAEQEPETLAARKLVFDAEAAMNTGEIDKAQDKYEEAFRHWADIFDRYPVLVTDITADTIGQSIDRYKSILDEETLPDDFPLKTFAEMRGPDGGRLDQNYYVEARQREKEKGNQTSSGDKSQQTSSVELTDRIQDANAPTPKLEPTSTPVAKTPEEPKPEEPTPEKPKPEEPKPEEPKPEEPKPEEPKPEEPKPEEPKPEEPKPEEPKPEEPKPEEPKPEEPKPEEPKPEEPKPEEPKPEEPKPEEPKPEEPKPEEPKPEEPKF
jgi:hypothetical protein